MARCLLVVLLVAFGCGRFSHPAGSTAASAGTGDRDGGAPVLVDTGVDAGSIATAPPAAPDAGSPDAGAPGIGVPDAGMPDAGSPDAGAAALDCAPYGAARLAWELVGYQNPANNYLASLYNASGDDGLDGVIIRHTILSGQEDSDVRSTFGPDGALRIPAIAGHYCHPVLGCTESFAVARNGRVFSSAGIAWASADGRVIYQIDSVSSGISSLKPLGTNGTLAVFVGDDPTVPFNSLVTAVDGDGATLWQRSLPQSVMGVSVDDATGITLLQEWNAGPELMAIGTSGGTLYTKTFTGNPTPQVAGGRFYVGGPTLFRVVDGTPALTLPFELGYPVLTSSRLVGVRRDEAGRILVSSFDLATSAVSWERPALDPRNFTMPSPFSLSGDRTLVLDPDRVLHVVEADGSDAIACKLGPDTWSPVMLSGGRLAISVAGNVRLQVYDLPWPGAR